MEKRHPERWLRAKFRKGGQRLSALCRYLGLQRTGLSLHGFLPSEKGLSGPAAITLLAIMVAICGCYSFTGASVPPHLKTVAIPLFDDQSGFGEAGLREKFTTALTSLFIQDNSLEVADRSTANAVLEGVIGGITDAPAVVGGGERVTKRQITMTVKCTFQDMKLKRKVWEKTFSEWGQYDSGGGLSQRNAGLDEAIRKLTEDILLETVSGW